MNFQEAETPEEGTQQATASDGQYVPYDDGDWALQFAGHLVDILHIYIYIYLKSIIYAETVCIHIYITSIYIYKQCHVYNVYDQRFRVVLFHVEGPDIECF